jgi:hypothetical protein
MPVTAASLATAVTATIIGMPATAGTTVQTAGTPVTVRSLSRGSLQQQGPYNSRATATADTFNIRKPATAGTIVVRTSRTPVTVGSQARPAATAGLLDSRTPTTAVPSATAELLPQLFPCNSRTPATAGSMQKQIACNSRDVSN